MIQWKFHENRIYWKDIKSVRHKPRNMVTPLMQQKWEWDFYNHKVRYDPQTTHCKGMCFGATQEP